MTGRAWLVGCALLAAAPAVAAPAAPAVITPVPPAAPIVVAGARTFVAFAGRPAPVTLAWKAVPGASAIRVRWNDGAQQTEVELPGTATTFERAEPRPGAHRVQLVAIANELESPPVELTIDVVKITAVAPGADSATPNDLAAFAVGARFSSPGLRCSFGGREPAVELTVTDPGAFVLRCARDQLAVEVPVVIAPVIVAADVAPIQRKRPTKIHVSVASVAPIGDLLSVDPIGDLDIDEVERTTAGLDITVTAGTSCDQTGVVVRSGDVELGRVTFDLLDAPPPPAPVITHSEWAAFDLGAHVGALSMPQYGDSANALGHPADPDDTIGSGPLAGLRLGIFPTRRIGLEFEAAVATTSYVGRLGVAAVLITRAQLAARIVEEGRFGLRGVAGGDIFTLLTDAGTSQSGSIGALHYGAAFSVETRRAVSVRFQALHVITSAQDAGYAHAVELQVGVVTRLGRFDRWN